MHIVMKIIWLSKRRMNPFHESLQAKRQIALKKNKVSLDQSKKNLLQLVTSNQFTLSQLKGIVHPKMKISQRFTHPQGILGMSDIPLLDEHILSYIQNCPVCSDLYNCSELCPCFWIRKKKVSIHHKTTPHGSGVLIKAFWSETMR